MKRISGKCFSNQEVRLDGVEYSNCSFQSCRFVYLGSKDFVLAGNIVSSDCVLIFRGRAEKTLSAMNKLYHLGEWGRENVIATIDQIAEVSDDLKDRWL